MAKDLAAFGTLAATSAAVDLQAILITEQRETNRLLRVMAGEAELAEPLPVPRRIKATRPQSPRRIKRAERKAEREASLPGWLR